MPPPRPLARRRRAPRSLLIEMLRVFDGCYLPRSLLARTKGAASAPEPGYSEVEIADMLEHGARRANKMLGNHKTKYGVEPEAQPPTYVGINAIQFLLELDEDRTTEPLTTSTLAPRVTEGIFKTFNAAAGVEDYEALVQSKAA